ncbi:unnamed protein product [Cuscuta campestris]|uniref:FAF domain-containing protein n=1 Tax=Cuscuta campestris TaxID=132261 RepID=A0A484KS73_9ASTE|nr:unnamed protein product [Cuscuta campestris]
MNSASSFQELGNNNALPVSAGIFDIPPLPRRSCPPPRRINLEMCTEGLGSENGARICESVDELFSLLLENEKSPPSSSAGGRRSRKASNRTPRSFPPPLSSMSGCNGVQVRPRRDGGRLVMTAVTVCVSSFVTERSGGRLRLWLKNAGDYKSNNLIGEENEGDEEGEEKGGACLDAAGDAVISSSAAAAKSRCMEIDRRNNGNHISWTGSQPSCYVAIS